MKIGKPKFYKKFKVIFGPDESDKFLDRFPTARCLYMKARPDLTPWGTREALMEEEIAKKP